MERDIPKFREAKGGPNIEILAAKRIATEFKKKLRLFHESESSEITFPLFITDYSDATGEPTIAYSDETITSLVRPKLTEKTLELTFIDNLTKHPRPIQFTDRAILPSFPFSLPPGLGELQGNMTVQLNTIFPLMSKSPFLEQIRRIQVSSISKSGKFEDLKGEIWLAQRWAHENLANELLDQVKRG